MPPTKVAKLPLGADESAEKLIFGMKKIDNREDARQPGNGLLNLDDELMAVNGAAHREQEHDGKAPERASGHRHALVVKEAGDEVGHQIGKRRRSHREQRHLPAHVGEEAKEGREFIAVITKCQARLHKGRKPCADAADGKDAHQGAGEEVADDAREHRLPDRKA